MISVDVERQDGRILPGSGYHCVHDAMEFRYWVTDWEPFEYFSTRMADPMHEGVQYHETYALEQTETGTEVRYTMGKSYDADGQRQEAAEVESAEFLENFWQGSFDEMEALIRKSV